MFHQVDFENWTIRGCCKSECVGNHHAERLDRDPSTLHFGINAVRGGVGCQCVTERPLSLSRAEVKSQESLWLFCTLENRISRGCRGGNTGCLFFPSSRRAWNIQNVCTLPLCACINVFGSYGASGLITLLWQKEEDKTPAWTQLSLMGGGT